MPFSFAPFPLRRTWIALLLFPCALGLAGCRHKRSQTEQVMDAVKKEAKNAKSDLTKGFQGAHLHGGDLSGGDAQGRPLWQISAKEIQAAAGEMIGGAPKQARFINAHAKLYREGVQDSLFSADVIDLYNTPGGLRLKMTGNVTATSIGPIGHSKTAAAPPAQGTAKKPSGLAGKFTESNSPIQLRAPRADVDLKTRVVAVSGGAVITRDTMVLHAPRVTAQASLKTMQFPAGLRATMPQGTLVARTGTWDWEKDHATAEDAQATQADVRLTGSHFAANTAVQRGEITGSAQAHSPRGDASGPRVTFDWKLDRIEAPQATFTTQGATMRAVHLVTDSKLNLTLAQGVTVQREGGVLTATTATGVDKLANISGTGITLLKDGARVTAARGTWGGGHITGQGGVRVEKQGSVLTAQGLDGDDKLENARLTGAARVTMQGGAVLTAPRLEKRGDSIKGDQGVHGMVADSGPFGNLNLKGDKMVASVAGGWVDLLGHVLVTGSRGARILAPQAHYDRARNTIYAAGNAAANVSGGVTFIDPERGLQQTGDSLLVNLITRQATLKNARGHGDNKLFDGKKLFG